VSAITHHGGHKCNCPSSAAMIPCELAHGCSRREDMDLLISHGADQHRSVCSRVFNIQAGRTWSSPETLLYCGAAAQHAYTLQSHWCSTKYGCPSLFRIMSQHEQVAEISRDALLIRRCFAWDHGCNRNDGRACGIQLPGRVHASSIPALPMRTCARSVPRLTTLACREHSITCIGI
jgi:hypothetical protein